MKKIAIITPFLAQGGLEKVAVTGAQELSKDYDITFIVFDTFIVDYPYHGKMIDLKVPFYGRNILKRLYAIILIAFKLRKIKKRENFDLMIVHGELANLSAVLSGKGKHIVVIHENRFAAVKDFQSTLFTLFGKIIYNAKNTAKLVTVSQGIKDRFIEKYHLKPDYIRTIHNPYDIEQIKISGYQKIDNFSNLFSSDILISAARLSDQKGHRYLLQIFQNLLKTDTKLKLVLLGDGELKDELTAFSKELGLKTYSVFSDDEYNDRYNVYFIGFQKNPFKYIAKSKLFIMSSLWEGFGNTIVESMACGTPVISTDCESGPREIIAPNLKNSVTDMTYSKYGMLAPAFTVESNKLSDDDIKIWTETLDKLFKEDKLLAKYVEVGRKRANDFDTSNIMQQWEKVIEETI